MPKYTIKNLKTFIGHEGHGYNADLYRDGKKVAFLIDAADGGELTIHWADMSKPRVEGLCRRWDGELYPCKMTVEEKILNDHIRDITHQCPFQGIQVPMTVDSFCAHLVDALEMDKSFKKKCRNATLFRLRNQNPGEYLVIRTKFSPEVATRIRAKHGDNLEVIYNERYA